MITNPKSALLPKFPWDALIKYAEIAQRHPDGIVNLSVGTPVDPTPQIIMNALKQAADAPSYPTVWGTPALHNSIISYLINRFKTIDLTPEAVMPAIGTKELVGLLPTLLNLSCDDLVVYPKLAYPTYQLGALMAGTKTQAVSKPNEINGRPALIWINSPSNPTGEVLTDNQLQEWIQYARQVGATIVSDECYAEFGWAVNPNSVLNRHICDTADNILVLHSLSKRSNMAGYRAGFAAGDPNIIKELIGLRKHLGLMVSTPVQQAMIAALGDQTHVVAQRARYFKRRELLKIGLQHLGFQIHHSEASLYLWATRDESCWDSVKYLADLGILVAPGQFYTDTKSNYIRVALTASDERVAAANERMLKI